MYACGEYTCAGYILGEYLLICYLLCFMYIPPVCKVPDLLNIFKILTIIGHCLGHQSGLDGSSGQTSTICLHGIAFHVYLVFSKIGRSI